jgi:hypothetical protein
MSSDAVPPGKIPQTETDDLIRRILEAIQGVRYGQVQITIQDSRVVQIDKTEKLRLV